MNQESLTTAQRGEALRNLGYTEREAAFLVTVALHGGYFLRRQYCEFIRKEVGGTAANLIDKLLTREHATAAIGCNNTKIYHLCSRPFYAAIGEEDNRNRRERPPFAIKNRLMGLDYVLTHPSHWYLATEREKLEYFISALGIAQSALPTKRFTSQKSKATTDRYFVDKYPIFIPPCGAENTPAVVSFCYIDEGVITGSRFGNYLRQYRSLFYALKSFRVIYVAASDRQFRIADRDFRSFTDNLGGRGDRLQIDPQSSRLLEYFQARALYESGRLESFNRAKLLQLRDDREEFSDPKYEVQFQCWKTGGAAAIGGNGEIQQKAPVENQAMFSTHLLRQDYNVFGAAPRTSDGA